MPITTAYRNTYSKAINVRVPKWDADRLEAICKARGVTKAQVIYHLVHEFVLRSDDHPLPYAKPDRRRKPKAKAAAQEIKP